LTPNGSSCVNELDSRRSALPSFAKSKKAKLRLARRKRVFFRLVRTARGAASIFIVERASGRRKWLDAPLAAGMQLHARPPSAFEAD
jgi:hypothetical protein